MVVTIVPVVAIADIAVLSAVVMVLLILSLVVTVLSIVSLVVMVLLIVSLVVMALLIVSLVVMVPLIVAMVAVQAFQTGVSWTLTTMADHSYTSLPQQSLHRGSFTEKKDLQTLCFIPYIDNYSPISLT